MKCISLLLLLFFEQIQGSTEMIQKFLPTEKGSLICFPEEMLPKNSTVSWLDHLNKTIGTYYPERKTKVEPPFNGKVKISGPTCLIFQFPRKSDSGVRCVRVTADQSKILRCFNVTFQDPVSPVELKIDVISKSSCDLKVTCSTEDVEINGTVRCDDKSCRLEGGERSKVTKSEAFVRLYQSNESIICNHSNQVNWTQNKTEIQPCLRSEGSTSITIIAVFTVVAAIAGAGVLLCCLKKKKLLCFAQKQTESSNSQMLPPAPQVNGDPGSVRLVEENIDESSV